LAELVPASYAEVFTGAISIDEVMQRERSEKK
jgi:hypothetical protein